jgi:hypothetical protein
MKTLGHVSLDMTSQLLLEKIIEKAVKGGWKCEWVGESYTVQELCFFIEGSYRVTHLLFDHSFAKAYFGERGQTKQIKDVQHDWEHTNTLNDTGQTKVYSCRVCHARKKGEVIWFYDGDGGETDVPGLASASFVFNPHKIAWWNPGWQHHIQQLALTPPEERLSYLEEYL